MAQAERPLLDLKTNPPLVCSPEVAEEWTYDFIPFTFVDPDWQLYRTDVNVIGEIGALHDWLFKNILKTDPAASAGNLPLEDFPVGALGKLREFFGSNQVEYSVNDLADPTEITLSSSTVPEEVSDENARIESRMSITWKFQYLVGQYHVAGYSLEREDRAANGDIALRRWESVIQPGYVREMAVVSEGFWYSTDTEIIYHQVDTDDPVVQANLNLGGANAASLAPGTLWEKIGRVQTGNTVKVFDVVEMYPAENPSSYYLKSGNTSPEKEETILLPEHLKTDGSFLLTPTSSRFADQVLMTAPPNTHILEF